MIITPYTGALVADDEELETAVADAELAPLIATIAWVTQDASWLAEEIRPPRSQLQAIVQPQGGMTLEQQELARARCLEGLKNIRDQHLSAPDTIDHNLVQKIVDYLAHEVPDAHRPALDQELGILGDRSRPTWTLSDINPDSTVQVVVIGGGMSGVVAGVRLKQAEVPFVVLEKNQGIGGSWWENTYPGCRLDTSNFAYSYSFAQRSDWPSYFSPQSEIQKYFEEVAVQHGVFDHIRFGVTVTGLTFDDEADEWIVHHTDPSGAHTTTRARHVITAVGQLNIPNVPELRGHENFQGPQFHTAQWPEGFSVEGKRVAVIGTGASGYQMVPVIAKQASHIDIYQRSAPWMLPTRGYLDDLPEGLAYLLQKVPTYSQWYRFWQVWIAVGGRHHLVKVDENWSMTESVSAANEKLRQDLLAEIEKQYTDRPELIPLVTPNYPPGVKRMLRDNGDWARVLKMESTDLVVDDIHEVTATGITTSDGTHREVDVIIYATGFRASDFLDTIDVVGPGGRHLREQWDGDARAYLGITVPHFPNLFMVYGPNTNLSVTGSIIFMSECATNHVVKILGHMEAEGLTRVEVRQEPHDRFNERIDRENSQRVWARSDTTSWYKNKFGRVSQNWPLDLLDYFVLTQKFDPDEYTFEAGSPQSLDTEITPEKGNR